MRDQREKNFLNTSVKHLFREVMKEAGIPESRRESIFKAVHALHTAFSEMDFDTQEKFFNMFKNSPQIVDGLLPVLCGFGEAEDLRWEFGFDYETWLEGKISEYWRKEDILRYKQRRNNVC